MIRLSEVLSEGDQEKKTMGDVVEIISRIKCEPYEFVLIEREDYGWLLQLRYQEADIVTGAPAEQKTRKWYISPFSTETEIVETAYAACLRSAKHRIREHFTYRDLRVMSPHLHIRARIAAAAGGMFDRRKERIDG